MIEYYRYDDTAKWELRTLMAAVDLTFSPWLGVCGPKYEDA